MATQSLYRRYRPRRFSEVKGQDHVVRALRNSVAEGREGQAYLFSGPRGTGKTTSARILAKVLNCTNARDGEPCCECESCLSVERGTSYDVHELDAASNNGVEAMRDLIDKASLGTPGRHKVYILDEVHMLTKAAEAALLKTLEEPPPHVVFVLATTDPQKMSDTIRSRTQHLQFHLFSADALQDHVRWVAADAGLVVSDEAIEQVVNQGAGSARDALSALELVANTGGEGAETVPLGEFLEAMIDGDAGRALKMAAAAINLGRDPRTLTEELIGYLRNGFMAIMAPELVQLPSQRVEALTSEAQRLGAAGLVRGIEKLGEALTEMRHAPDPRILLDVAIVQLTSDSAGTDLAALTARIAKLEKLVANAPAPPASAATAPAPAATPMPVNPKTGRAALGGRARSPEPAPAAAPAPAAPAQNPPPAAATEPPAAAAAPTSARTTASTHARPEPASSGAPAGATSAMSQAVWEDGVRPALRGMTRAVFSPAEYVSCTSSSLTLNLPNPVHRDKCEQHRASVEQALSDAAGGPVSLELVVGGGGDNGGDNGGGGGDDDTGTGGGDTARGPQPIRDRADTDQPTAPTPPAPTNGDDSSENSVATPEAAVAESPRRAAERKLAEAARNGSTSDDEGPDAEVYVLPEDHEVDLTDLIDAPPETVKTPIDRLAEAFPGSEMVEETY